MSDDLTFLIAKNGVTNFVPILHKILINTEENDDYNKLLLLSYLKKTSNLLRSLGETG